ncbi:MAG: hypothetical protein ACR2OO_15345 [Thermomicrobiales bacterium]
MGDGPTPSEIAAVFAALVDLFLPGDADFPSGSSAGTHGLVMERVRERLGAPMLGVIAAGLSVDDAAFLDVDPARRGHALASLERADPATFALLRSIVYFSYYETPTVVAALRAIGHDYNDAPQPHGYAMAPFDPRPGVHAPASPRGTYKRTEEIGRVDLSTLADLDLPVKGV